MPYGNNALSVRIADQLTDMIANQRFLPGDKLPNEIELADELQVSRTTLREALRILTTRGLVEVRRGMGMVGGTAHGARRAGRQRFGQYARLVADVAVKRTGVGHPGLFLGRLRGQQRLAVAPERIDGAVPLHKQRQ